MRLIWEGGKATRRREGAVKGGWEGNAGKGDVREQWMRDFVAGEGDVGAL